MLFQQIYLKTIVSTLQDTFPSKKRKIMLHIFAGKQNFYKMIIPIQLR